MKTKGTTLTELLIVTVLLSVVMLAVMAVNISARRFLTATQLSSKAQNEASFVLEHMHKNVRLGVGSILNPGIGDLGLTLPDKGFKVRIDRDGDGRPNEAINEGIGYYYAGDPDFEIRFVPDLSAPDPEVIGEGITDFDYTITDNFLTIDNLTATKKTKHDETDPDRIVRSVTLETGIILRQMSGN